MKKLIGAVFMGCLFWGTLLLSQCLYAEIATNNFLVFSDIHLDHNAFHTMDISPSSTSVLNDLDPSSFETLVAEVAHNIKTGVVAQPKFILILGDLVGHIRFTSDSVEQSELAVFQLLQKTFPTTPIFYTFGNNDSYPQNYGPFFDQSSTSSNRSPYDVAVRRAHWSDGFLSTGAICDPKQSSLPCLLSENKISGYYSAYLETKLRLISINSVMFSPKQTAISTQEVQQQLQWLETQLSEVKRNHEMALITMHIPPGYDVYNHSRLWEAESERVFLNLISTYRNNIAGLLASHTHAEEIKLLKDRSNHMVTGLYLTAALSTSHGNAPSVKTFFYAEEDGAWSLINYKTFFFSQPNNQLLLAQLYDAKNTYCEGSEHALLSCLSHVTADKMKRYFSAGNVNYPGVMAYPDDLFIIVPDQ